MTDTPLHVRLRQYRVIAVSILLFCAWQIHQLTSWYFVHFKELQEWQNAGFGTLALAYVGVFKLALEHILDERNDVCRPS